MPRIDTVRRDGPGALNRRRDLPGTWWAGGCQDDLGAQLPEPVTADNLLLTSYQNLVMVPSYRPGGRGIGVNGAARPRARFPQTAQKVRTDSATVRRGACIIPKHLASKARQNK